MKKPVYKWQKKTDNKKEAFATILAKMARYGITLKDLENELQRIIDDLGEVIKADIEPNARIGIMGVILRLKRQQVEREQLQAGDKINEGKSE